jgi:hypothetical protein
MLPLKGGVRLRTVLPIKIFRYQASYVKRVGGERMALNGTLLPIKAFGFQTLYIQGFRCERTGGYRTSRRCCRCGARSRQSEYVRIVRYNGACKP